MKIGAFTFGSGMSMLAQLDREFCEKRGLITKDELLEITSVGNSLPGIMIANISLLLGCHIAGAAGGVAAALGLTVPACVIITAVAYFYDFIRDNFWFAAAMRGVNAAVIALVLTAVLNLSKNAFRERGAAAICALAFLLAMFTGLGKIYIIAIGVAAALIWMGAEKAVKK